MTDTLTAPAVRTTEAAPGSAAVAEPLCTHCGTGDRDAFRTVSRHRTSTGTTVWLRCRCGSLQVRVVDRRGQARTMARGRPRHAAG